MIITFSRGTLVLVEWVKVTLLFTEMSNKLRFFLTGL